MSRHPLVLAAEVELEKARRAEVDAKNAAEAAMRHWAWCAANVGGAESTLHWRRRYLTDASSVQQSP